jgi:GDP-4-dehydro-6-deoxy-D-mannose reductase
MKRVMVFGYAGFSGRYFLDYALNHGFGERYEFWGADISTAKTHPVLSGVRALDGSNYAEMRELIRELAPEYTVNLVGLFGHRTLEEFVRVNVWVTKNLLDAYLELGVKAEKILLIGSAAEYGVGCANPIAETVVPRPANNHGLSKFLQTCLASHYYAQFGLPITIARTFNIIGEGASPELAIGRFEKEINETNDGGTILVGDLMNKRDFLSGEDVARYYWELLTKGVAGEVYNVCSGKSISIYDVLDSMIKASGKHLETKRDPTFTKQGDLSDIYGDNSKLSALLI